MRTMNIQDAARAAGADPGAVLRAVVAGTIPADLAPTGGYRLDPDEVRRHFAPASPYERLTSTEIDSLRKFAASPIAQAVASKVLLGDTPLEIKAKLDAAHEEHSSLMQAVRSLQF